LEINLTKYIDYDQIVNDASVIDANQHVSRYDSPVSLLSQVINTRVSTKLSQSWHKKNLTLAMVGVSLLSLLLPLCQHVIEWIMTDTLPENVFHFSSVKFL
jgi:hypothetical protein